MREAVRDMLYEYILNWSLRTLKTGLGLDFTLQAKEGFPAES